MAAAVSRRTAGGAVLGAEEALTPEAALALFLADPQDLARRRTIAPGAPADLCLLDRPWRAARGVLSADLVGATLIGGRIVHDRIHQPQP
jgi:predicted amidohydrolase YtcJ